VKVFNTLTRRKEEFTPITPGEVRMYTCGPTVYNFIHIGTARFLCVFDTLRRYLEYRGFQVIFVQNFTDVDDKIIKRANEEGVSSREVAERFIAEHKTDALGLNVREATVHPKATESIPEIIALVSELIGKGCAYEAQGDVYFGTKTFNEYGKLSHQPLEELEAGARVMLGEVKREPMDFALWKAAKPGEPAWDSPWGKGRPGWHIECSAMVKKHLGLTIDLHCGGQDLVFPHHENEIAQSECANGAPFANYWMHNGMIDVDNVKMSKSLGNFFTVREVAGKYGYEPIRYLMLASHYRSPLNYSVESVEQAKASLQRLYTCRENLEFAMQNAPEDGGGMELGRYREAFIGAMEDDLNTAGALGSVFDLVREANTRMAGASRQALQGAAALFDELTGVLGLVYNRKQARAGGEVEELVAERTRARAAKDWKRADEIRARLKGMGVVIEDTPQGTKIVQNNA
jgi:cysteinyl-tRNA synthetase